ncbi:LysR family transcriptional regulator [Ralstonia wenshanensis]|uniref:LysR family transcriptional regulator n=1 Tax=Ralstonia wenshanensis TaxID=2842456 RepID=UPI002AADC194|nr:LysR substrate-binding domain-containing protein [Ralstonia wenshanensis]MDY7511229.1 LysR substrate-binding domain-containing protein [Ralstonia wenshanensis]
MELRQLRMFCAAAESGSFTAAAEKVHCVQSNITMRVKELESELRQPLFVRHKSGITLTSAGETFLGYAQRILQLTEESRSALLDSSEPIGNLRLGSMETTAAVRLPAVLTSYREQYPKVHLSLTTGTTAELIKAVESHRLDGAFIGGFHQNPGLLQEAILNEELVLVSSSKYDSLELLTTEMTQQTVLVFRSGCFYRSSLERWLHHVGLIPGQILELGTLDGILSCAATGMGVTILPRAVVDHHQSRDRIACHRLPDEFANVVTVFIRRKDSYETAAMRAMVSMAHTHFS